MNQPEYVGLRSFATGTCFRITEDQQFEVLWKSDGFYAFGDRLTLSRDGSTLIRVVDIVTTDIQKIKFMRKPARQTVQIPIS